MKATITFFSFFFILCNIHSFAQFDNYYADCKDLKEILDDAANEFDEYYGELEYEDYVESIYSYEKSLWNDEERHLYEEFAMGFPLYTVEFYYTSYYDLEKARSEFVDILEKVAECLHGNYYRSSYESKYAIQYAEYTDSRDMDSGNGITHPQVEVMLVKKEDYYYSLIRVWAP